jgi:predicted AAA+ superfamily ATPase
MYRKAITDLITWKNRPDRKPLVVQGARQVGKTWLMQEFGRQEYAGTAYFNFDRDKTLETIFHPDLNPRRIIEELETRGRQKILPGETLIIFDEIQECNRALVSLKYFCEEAGEYHIIAAGSLLGVTIHRGNSYPVGKTDALTLYPLSFAEFLAAVGEGRILQLFAEKNFRHIEILKDEIIRYLKQYFYIGGMPGAVLSFTANRDLEKVREIQEIILNDFSRDFSKHIASSSIPKLALIWNSIPVQLGKEKKRFIYKDMKPGARSGLYEDALQWLTSCGLVYKINRVSLPNMPLKAYEEADHFKLYSLDVGLLSAQTALSMRVLSDPDPALFNHFKGALTEQFVLQELKTLQPTPPEYYWTNEKNTSSVDFVIQAEEDVIPLEVKAAVNLKSKSLKSYIDKWKPRRAVRTSLSDYSKNTALFEVPLYLMGNLWEIIRNT